jgi:hypothetical protein
MFSGKLAPWCRTRWLDTLPSLVRRLSNPWVHHHDYGTMAIGFFFGLSLTNHGGFPLGFYMARIMMIHFVFLLDTRLT